MRHLAIFNRGIIEKILSGEKTIETRFSVRRLPPYGSVSVGDEVLMKESGREITGKFTVGKVISFENFNEEDLRRIRELYDRQIAADQFFWQDKKEARFATLMFIANPSRFLTSPVKIKKKDLRGWVVLK